jgi:hypothetical protein
MRVKIHNNRFKVFNTRAKYNYPPESANVVNTIQLSVGLSAMQRLYAHFLVGMEINENLWIKNKAFYGMLGGTADTHKWNWKDMRNLDAAYRLVFSGGIIHSNLGAKPNGSTGSANTFVPENVTGSLNNLSLSYNSGTNILPEGSIIEMGVAPGGDRETSLRFSDNGIGNFFGIVGRFTQITTGFNPNTTGQLTVSRTSSTVLNIFKYGNLINTNTSTNTAIESANSIFLFSVNDAVNGRPLLFSPRLCRSSSIGSGLTIAESLSTSQIINFAQSIRANF